MIDAVAPYLTVRAVPAGMLEAGWGRIVNVTSAASLHPPGALNSAYGDGEGRAQPVHPAPRRGDRGHRRDRQRHPPGRRADRHVGGHPRQGRGHGPGRARPTRPGSSWVDETGGDPPHKAVDLILRSRRTRAASATASSAGSRTRSRRRSPRGRRPPKTQPWLAEERRTTDGPDLMDPTGHASGRTDVAVTVLGFGGASIGELFHKVPEEDAIAAVRAAWDPGIRYFDTAPWYGRGLSELRTGAGPARQAARRVRPVDQDRPLAKRPRPVAGVRPAPRGSAGCASTSSSTTRTTGSCGRTSRASCGSALPATTSRSSTTSTTCTTGPAGSSRLLRPAGHVAAGGRSTELRRPARSGPSAPASTTAG